LAGKVLGKNSLQFDLNLNPSFVFGIESDHLERHSQVVGDDIAHQLELSVRRSKSDGLLFRKLIQFDAAMKSHVLEGHRGLVTSLANNISLQTQFVIQSKSTLRIPTELTFDLNPSLNF
jgi:hypothetical protein